MALSDVWSALRDIRDVQRHRKHDKQSFGDEKVDEYLDGFLGYCKRVQWC